MQNKYSFWGLINQFHVVIPLLQRDYAQGRIDEKINTLRDQFVNTLIDALIQKHRCELDFIFGTVQNTILEPLDGQQRLTTLFLLHLYLALHANQIHANAHHFKKLSYETRLSSKYFIIALIENLPKLKTKLNDEKISVLIKDQTWFFSIWLNDPTIQSMLTMLDTIQKALERKQIESAQLIQLWQYLISNETPLQFSFIDLENFSLTDELYIKMNARGVQLTEFENFKAWFQQELSKVPNVHTDKVRNFLLNVDISYTDFLWKLRPKNTISIDHLFMTVIKCIALSRYILSDNALSPDQDTSANLISRLSNNDYLPISSYGKYIVDPEQLNSLQQGYSDLDKLFEFLIRTQREYSTLWENFQPILTDLWGSFSIKESDKGLSYLKLSRFAILCALARLYHDEPIIDGELMEGIFSSSLILVNNAKGYFNNEKEYIYVIKGIEQWVRFAYSTSIVKFNLDSKNPKHQPLLQAFSVETIQHEIIKAQKIQVDPTWKDLIRFVEKHSYFYGQIEFLLDISGDDQVKFKKNGLKASILFSDKILQDSTHILSRTLLSYSQYAPYLIKDGHNLSFCQSKHSNARDRNENWRRVFKDPSKLVILQHLIDKDLSDINEKTSLEEQTQQIIQEMENVIKRNLDSIHDWRKLFINIPKILDFSKFKQIRKETEDYYVLKGYDYRSVAWPLHLYALLIDLKEKKMHLCDFKKLEMIYWTEPQNSSVNMPAIHIQDDENIQIIIQYQQNEFQFSFYKEGILLRDFDLLPYEMREKLAQVHKSIEELTTINI